VIVGALLRCGATVQSLAAVGQGCPDLMVGFRGRTLCFEVKDGSKSPSRRALTEDQKQWHAAWAGHVVVVESVEQAIAALVTIPEAACN
jgi:hypothetical protein